MPIAPRWVSSVFQAAALLGWAVALLAVVAPEAVTGLLGMETARYPTLVRIWAGIVFLFGFVFWEIAQHPIENTVLVKYAWLQKTIALLAVALGAAGGELPWRVLGLVLVTDGLWIPPFLYADYLLRDPH